MNAVVRRLAKGVFPALILATGFGFVFESASAVAAKSKTKTVTVGQLFTPVTGCGEDTFLMTSVASGKSYTVPKAGVITSWSFDDGSSKVSGLQLKVARRAGGGKFTIVAQARAHKQRTNAVNTYTANIPVKAGDVIGLYTSGTGLCSTDTSNPSDINVFADGNQAPGTTTSYAKGLGYKLPISVRVKE